MNWSFAMLNGRLSEIFFENTSEGLVILGHCYITRDEYSKSENKMIDQDIKLNKLTYRHKQYYDQIKKVWLKTGSFM